MSGGEHGNHEGDELSPKERKAKQAEEMLKMIRLEPFQDFTHGEVEKPIEINDVYIAPGVQIIRAFRALVENGITKLLQWGVSKHISTPMGTMKIVNGFSYNQGEEEEGAVTRVLSTGMLYGPDGKAVVGDSFRMDVNFEDGNFSAAGNVADPTLGAFFAGKDSEGIAKSVRRKGR